MAIISFFVKAHLKELFKEVPHKIDIGETKRNFFGFNQKIKKIKYEQESIGYSDTQIDGDLLAKDIEDAINHYGHEGYELVSITPITSGAYNSKVSLDERRTFIGGYETLPSSKTYAYGYGYSYTEGVNIIMKK